jgi:hypothetical protein
MHVVSVSGEQQPKLGHALTREAHESWLELQSNGHIVEYGRSGILLPEIDIPRYAELHEEVRHYAIEGHAVVISTSYQFHEPRCAPGGPVSDVTGAGGGDGEDVYRTMSISENLWERNVRRNIYTISHGLTMISSGPKCHDDDDEFLSRCLNSHLTRKPSLTCPASTTS